MNFNCIPAKSVVMYWNPEVLADYLKSMKLSGCDKVVKKTGMNGSWFLAMSNKDLQKFPKVHRAQITQLCNEMTKAEERKRHNERTNPSSHSWQDCGHIPESSEFDDDDDDDDDDEPDYEQPDEFEDNYICAASEEGYNERHSDDDYEPPPSAVPEIPSHSQISKPLHDGDYIDCIRGTSAKDRTPKPPQRPDSADFHPAMCSAESFSPNLPGRDFSSQTSQNNKSAPSVDRSKKPRSILRHKQNPDKSEEERYPLNRWNTSPTASQLPIQSMIPDQQMRSFSEHAQQHFMTPDSQKDMDSQWYAGPMTRGEAEQHLRQINMDGAFLIRDSSKNNPEQPYTLMVLKEHKVYNIQIRFHGNPDGYSLGTGLMGSETFCSVRDIVTHYREIHLLLIDALDRTSGAQQQCCLLHPAMC